MKTLAQSIRFAVTGFWYAWHAERNLRIEAVLAVSWVVLAVVCGIPGILVACIVFFHGCVIAFELGNSAIEQLLDVVTPRLSPQVAQIKNVLASMVLVAGVSAQGACVLMVWPYVIERLFGV